MSDVDDRDRPLPWPGYSRSERSEESLGPGSSSGHRAHRRCGSSAASPRARAARSKRVGRAPSPRRSPGWRSRGPDGFASGRGPGTRTWRATKSVAWHKHDAPAAHLGQRRGGSAARGVVAIACSRRFSTSSSSVMSRSQERAFHDRSRCPSKILLIAECRPSSITGLQARLPKIALCSVSSAPGPAMIYPIPVRYLTTEGIVPDRPDQCQHSMRLPSEVRSRRAR